MGRIGAFAPGVEARSMGKADSLQMGQIEIAERVIRFAR